MILDFRLLYHFPERGLKHELDRQSPSGLQLSPLPLPREGIETHKRPELCNCFCESPLPLPREGIETFVLVFSPLKAKTSPLPLPREGIETPLH